jgi:hypothetical protein
MTKKRLGRGYYQIGDYTVEQKADGTWAAALPVDGPNSWVCRWYSPKHATMRSAMQSIAMHRRKTR